MAEALAQILGTLWVPEFARYYVAHLGRPYMRADLRAIGAGQKKWETWYAHRAAATPTTPLLLADTDWTVLQIWEQYRFGAAVADAEWQKGYGTAENADLYLLCTPDFPWQEDPLREHPDERDELFQLYRRLLQERQADFIHLSGPHDARLQTALAAIRKFL